MACAHRRDVCIFALAIRLIWLRAEQDLFLITVRFTTDLARWFARAPLALRRRDADSPRASGRHLGPRVLIRLAVLFLLLAAAPEASAQIELPQADPSFPIVVAAQRASRWTEGTYDVWLLEGDCRISQGSSRASADQAVLWINRQPAAGAPAHKVTAYLEGSVAIERMSAPLTGIGSAAATASPGGSAPPVPLARLEDKNWFGRLASTSAPEVRVPQPQPAPAVKPAIYQHAIARGATQAQTVQQAQFETVVPAETLPPMGARRIRAFPRSGVPVQAQWFPNPAANESIAVINSGVNLVIDGLDSIGGLPVSGSIDISADRMVIWTADTIEPDLSGNTGQDARMPLELYMEGNIVLREGDRIVQSQAMYYNVNQRTGVILDAELLTPVPQFQGLVRLKADVLRQVNQDLFVADRGSLTTSRLGIPTYEFRSGQLTLLDNQIPTINPLTGQPAVDERGVPIVEHRQTLTGQNNVLQIEGVPVLYWPFFATDLRRPPLYIDNFQVRSDRVFGTQVLLDLDMYQILGLRNPPEGTDWDISLDYLSDRGFGMGTIFDYDRTGMFGWPGRYNGFVDAWYINDHGHDNLGLGRRDLTFPDPFRGRTVIQHRQELPSDWLLRFEFGQITDGNFLEQYYEQEWDEQKDQVTRLDLYRIWDNMSLEFSASALINPNFTQTQNLPRLDHYWLGQPLLYDSLTWYEHTNIGYLRQDLLEPPVNPPGEFSFLPYDANVRGERLATRHEIDWPFQLGPVKLVPYALGELAHWGEVLNQDDLQRAYGQVGMRASIPFWTVNPAVESTLWNVHGIAHKVVFDAEFSYTDSSQNLDELAIYDEIDDDNIQAFRRRIPFEDYAGVSPVPLRFDERFYGVRRGMMDWVTGPTEIADDLTVFRLGVDQRWQTKRGFPGQRRIIDWMTLDTDLELFPSPEQNFGQTAGLLDYDFNWFVGDRLTLLAYGGFDFFSEGQKWTTVGGYLTRPPRGSLYLGFNTFEGPITANVVTASYSYRMSPKWYSTFGTSFDVNRQNIGENFRLTRIGESFLFTVGFNVDTSRDNFGANIALIPRFIGRSRTTARGKVDIPPAGIYGLE